MSLTAFGSISDGVCSGAFWRATSLAVLGIQLSSLVLESEISNSYGMQTKSIGFIAGN
jgi:hypothetical protein